MIWKTIEEYPQYEVSSEGQVRRNAKILKPQLNSKGYYRINICVDSKISKPLLHRLVAKAFIPNPENKPQVNHINGDKTDNRVENLEWVTNSENLLHGRRLGLIKSPCGEDSPNAKLTEEQVRMIKQRYVKGSRQDGAAQIARELGVGIDIILAIVKGRKWKHVIL